MPSCGNSLPFASTTAMQAQPANSKAMNHPATLDVALIAFMLMPWVSVRLLLIYYSRKEMNRSVWGSCIRAVWLQHSLLKSKTQRQRCDLGAAQQSPQSLSQHWTEAGPEQTSLSRDHVLLYCLLKCQLNITFSICIYLRNQMYVLLWYSKAAFKLICSSWWHFPLECWPSVPPAHW